MVYLQNTEIMETNDPGETETVPTFPIEPGNTEKYSTANYESETIPNFDTEEISARTNLLGKKVKYCDNLFNPSVLDALPLKVSKGRAANF